MGNYQSEGKNITETRLDLNGRAENFGYNGACLLSKALAENTTLTSLNIEDNKIGDDGLCRLSSTLANNNTLTKLNLANNDIFDLGTKALAEALKINSSLKVLYLYWNKIGVEGVEALSSALAKNATLSHLNLGGNCIGVRGASSLSSCLKINTTLTDLELFENKIDNKTAIELSPFLNTNSTLTLLNLSDNNIGADGILELSKAIAINAKLKLCELNLGSNNIGNLGASYISQALIKNNSLTILDLCKNSIGDDGARDISVALKTNTTLTQLHLDSNRITDIGAIHLASSIKALIKLNLGNNNIGVRGVNALSSSLKINSTLTDLNLHRNSIGPDGAKELSTSLNRNNTLASLNISGNSIGPEGAKDLSTSLIRNNTLTTLNISGNKIGAEGAKDISLSLKRNSTLITLVISGNNIGIEGANAISSSLKTNTTLKKLVVGNEPGEVNLDQEMKLRNSGILLKEKEVEREKEKIINTKKVKEWFQTISLSPEQQEEYSNFFIQEDFNNLHVISSMTESDLTLMRDKLKLTSGNYRKIYNAVEELKQSQKVLSKSSPPIVHPWHIESSVKNRGNWIKENNTLSFLPLPLDDMDPSLQFKNILTSLNGSLDELKSVQLCCTTDLESLFQAALDAHLRSLQDSPDVFKNEMWRFAKEEMAAGVLWREAIHTKFFEYALKFPNNINREKGLVVIPAVTGYKTREIAIKVCNNGPKSLGGVDDGYFGRGIYFSTHINYAKKFGKFLVVFWVFIGNLYPVIEFPHPPVGSEKYYDKLPSHQKPTLCGKPQKNDKIIKDRQIKTVTYDTHFTIVRPFTDEGESETVTMKYVPCEVERMDGNVFGEVVVFQESHVLPMYLIELH